MRVLELVTDQVAVPALVWGQDQVAVPVPESDQAWDLVLGPVSDLGLASVRELGLA